MKYKSVFDIIGPVMVGPSSSHTAGAVRIGQLARSIFGYVPDCVYIHFYGSFAKSYKGHATDVAIAAGILGLSTDDPNVKDSISLAKEKGIELSFFIEDTVTNHPNTVKLVLKKSTEILSLTGVSIGGGLVEIIELNGFLITISGNNPTILIFHKDAYGAIAKVTSILEKYYINIGHMEVSRLDKGSIALMIIETDQKICNQAVLEINNCDNINKTIVLDL